MEKPPKSVWIDETATASTPGRLVPDLWWYSLNYPKWPLIWTATVVLSVLATVTISLWFSIAAVLSSFLLFKYRQHVIACFHRGDLIAARAVGRNRIAIRTDLTKGEGDYPVMVVTRAPIARLRCELGEPLPVHAMYVPTGRAIAHWAGIFPKVVRLACRDRAVCEGALSRIHRDEWDALDADYARLDRPTEPGVYCVDGDWPVAMRLRLRRRFATFDGEVVDDRFTDEPT